MAAGTLFAYAMVNDVDRVCLRMFLGDLEGANPGCIQSPAGHCKAMSREGAIAVNWKRRTFSPIFAFEGQTLNVHLDMMP